MLAGYFLYAELLLMTRNLLPAPALLRPVALLPCRCLPALPLLGRRHQPRRQVNPIYAAWPQHGFLGALPIDLGEGRLWRAAAAMVSRDPSTPAFHPSFRGDAAQ